MLAELSPRCELASFCFIPLFESSVRCAVRMSLRLSNLAPGLRAQGVAERDGHKPPVSVLRGARRDDALPLPTLVGAVECIPVGVVLEVRHHAGRHERVAHHVGVHAVLFVREVSKQSAQV